MYTNSALKVAIFKTAMKDTLIGTLQLRKTMLHFTLTQIFRAFTT